MKNILISALLLSLTSCSAFAPKNEVPTVQDASWACENSKLQEYEVNAPGGRFKLSCKKENAK